MKLLQNILPTTKCGNLTPLLILVDDNKRINANIPYTWYYNPGEGGQRRVFL